VVAASYELSPEVVELFSKGSECELCGVSLEGGSQGVEGMYDYRMCHALTSSFRLELVDPVSLGMLLSSTAK
jgi:hypothetical protein